MGTSMPSRSHRGVRSFKIPPAWTAKHKDPRLLVSLSILRLHVAGRAASLLRMEVTFDVAQRVRIVAHPVRHQIIGPQRGQKIHVLLHVSGDLSALERYAVA